jgi:hypothetical protein
VLAVPRLLIVPDADQPEDDSDVSRAVLFYAYGDVMLRFQVLELRALH